MMRIALSLIVSVMLTLAGRAFGDEQNPAATPAAPTTRPSALSAVAPFVGGEWRIKATWAGGNPLEARAIYDWGLNKKFVVAKTFVKLPEGGEYQRYETIFGDDKGQLMSYGFTFNGEVHVLPMAVDGRTISDEWTVDGENGSVRIKQRIELLDDNHFHWQVWSAAAGADWKPMMDGTWVRGAASAKK
ncbi:MAG TPA: hypothetical protein VH518_04490 [Tepidisphaeraceae bacterium]|jgi:hypothetical protein